MPANEVCNEACSFPSPSRQRVRGPLRVFMPARVKHFGGNRSVQVLHSRRGDSHASSAPPASLALVAFAQETSCSQTVRVRPYHYTYADLMRNFKPPRDCFCRHRPQRSGEAERRGRSSSAWTPGQHLPRRGCPVGTVLVDAGFGSMAGPVGGSSCRSASEKMGRRILLLSDLILITDLQDPITSRRSPHAGWEVRTSQSDRAGVLEGERFLARRDLCELPQTSAAPQQKREQSSRCTGRRKPFDLSRRMRTLAHAYRRSLVRRTHFRTHGRPWFTSKGQTLWCIGDPIHYGRVQFTHPEAGAHSDGHLLEAIVITQQVTPRAAEEHILVAGGHLPEVVGIGGGVDAGWSRYW